MSLTNGGKNFILGLLTGTSSGTIDQGGFGIDFATAPTDTTLQSSVLVCDTCDATTGWTIGGDAIAPTLDSSNFRQSTASLNLGMNYSTGESTYSKTISAVDVSSSNAKVYFFIYLTDVTTLSNVNDAVQLLLGTGGFTNANQYNYSRGGLSNGWNALIATVATTSTTIGAGATTSSVDSVAVHFKSGNTIPIGNMKLDYIRAVVQGGNGIAESLQTPTVMLFDRSAKISFTSLTTQCDGYDFSAAGVSVSDSSLQFSKTSFSTINKNSTMEVQYDEYLAVK